MLQPPSAYQWHASPTRSLPLTPATFFTIGVKQSTASTIPLDHRTTATAPGMFTPFSRRKGERVGVEVQGAPGLPPLLPRRVSEWAFHIAPSFTSEWNLFVQCCLIGTDSPVHRETSKNDLWWRICEKKLNEVQYEWGWWAGLLVFPTIFFLSTVNSRIIDSKVRKFTVSWRHGDTLFPN